MSRFFGLVGILALIYAFVEPFFLRVNRLDLSSHKLPSAFEGYKIAFISDIHNHSKSAGMLKRVIRKINRLKPDVVLIGGDFNSENTVDHEVCFKVLSELMPPVYTVLGNHDYYNCEELAKKLMKKYNIGSINNKSFWVEKNGEKIKIGGLDDYWMGYPYPESFFHDVTEDDFTVLVCHNPDFFECLDMSCVSLAFAGHHHGGQCSFFGLWAPMVRSEFGMKYSGKTRKEGNSVIVCSNGIGTSHIPVRFCAVPEINFVTLHSEDKKDGYCKNFRC